MFDIRVFQGHVDFMQRLQPPLPLRRWITVAMPLRLEFKFSVNLCPVLVPQHDELVSSRSRILLHPPCASATKHL
ncbi:hypothetical protein F2Q69_00038534 [Brassica cretica]|uniref:Uncharacterized protein n=1 Tax=Brassica cretica TaxID=69181 RepID=A0A8S9SM37_BRACR|nr:hypothetical protein F2Q69_00038534 [Brassica cretica]